MIPLTTLSHFRIRYEVKDDCRINGEHWSKGNIMSKEWYERLKEEDKVKLKVK